MDAYLLTVSRLENQQTEQRDTPISRFPHGRPIPQFYFRSGVQPQGYRIHLCYSRMVIGYTLQKFRRTSSSVDKGTYAASGLNGLMLMPEDLTSSYQFN